MLRGPDSLPAVVGLSVHPSIHPSICPSVRLSFLCGRPFHNSSLYSSLLGRGCLALPQGRRWDLGDVGDWGGPTLSSKVSGI